MGFSQRMNPGRSHKPTRTEVLRGSQLLNPGGGEGGSAYLRSGPEARRPVPPSRRRAPPAANFCKIYKKRCEERRGETLAGARRCRGREGDERPDAEEEVETGGGEACCCELIGGDQVAAAALPRLTSRGKRSEATSGGRGVLPDVWRPGAIPRGTGLTRAANPYTTGFQICILDSMGTISAWAANPGSDGDPGRDMGFQTKP